MLCGVRLGAISIFVGLMVGCAEPGRRDRLQQRVVGGDPDAVLAAATPIMQREFGRVLVDPANRRITCGPAEFVTERESGTARDLYRGSSVMRRSGLFEVAQANHQTVVRIRIDVERQDTQRQRAMQPQAYRISDTPGSETPLTQDAATTEAQNTVWTKVRRDTRLEHALLDELREMFARGPAETSPSP